MSIAGFAQVEQQVRAMIAAGAGIEAPRDDEHFDVLALNIFALQFETRPDYRDFCLAQGRTPETVTGWEQIPPLPDTEQLLPRASEPLAETSLLSLAESYLFPDDARMPVLALSEGEPGSLSPLARISRQLIAAYGADGSAIFAHDGALDKDRLAAALRYAEQQQPVCLIGSAATYRLFLDWCGAQGMRFALASGSRLIDAGGGEEHEPPRDELYTRYREQLGLPLTACINLYQPAGLASTFIDNTLYDAHRRDWRPRHKVVPPWVRTLIVDPGTGEPVRRGLPGLLRHLDLANLHGVAALQTQQQAVAVGHGFEIVRGW